ncbi:hypothetical protein WH158_07270 [Gluconobacter cerinus]|uniref:hypothetical protein n=1 Tax=Gluconobacter cerinus TaxID=38307 RepID=UPI0030B34C81
MHHLTLRGRTYCVRFIIPKDRWFDVGKATGSTTGRRRDIVRTLGTQCRFEALRRRDAAISAICNHLNQVLQEADMEPLGSGWIPQWSSDASNGELPLATANKACVRPSSADAIMTKTPKRRALERWQRQEEPECLGVLLTRWHRELDGQVTNELLDRHRLSLRYLGEFLLGQETGDPMAHVLSLRLSDVTKREVSGFREWMIQTKGIQPVTAGFRLSCLKSFWDWSSDAGLMDGPNPWQGAARGLKRRAEKTLKPNGEKRPFTEAELLALLSADPQTNRNGKWGPAIHDIFRLGLLTGARQNELASLTVGRVIHSERPDVLWGIRVTADVGKTKSALRQIPLHPIARAIVERRLKALPHGIGQDALLFPECVPGGRDEKHGHYLSKRFATFRQAILGKDSPTDFHSTRRCFATFMATALANGVSECSELVRDHLIGHKPMALGSNTYAAKDLGWDLYCRAVLGMVEKGIPEAVREAV